MSASESSASRTQVPVVPDPYDIVRIDEVEPDDNYQINTMFQKVTDTAAVEEFLGKYGSNIFIELFRIWFAKSKFPETTVHVNDESSNVIDENDEPEETDARPIDFDIEELLTKPENRAALKRKREDQMATATTKREEATTIPTATVKEESPRRSPSPTADVDSDEPHPKRPSTEKTTREQEMVDFYEQFARDHPLY